MKLDMTRPLTTGKAAKICQVAPRTLSAWVDSGKLRGYRIPGSRDRRINPRDLIKFMEDNGFPHDMIARAFPHDIVARVVLVVSDDAIMADRLKSQLEPRLKIVVANNAFHAGQLFGEAAPVIGVVDFSLASRDLGIVANNVRYAIGIHPCDQMPRGDIQEAFEKPFDIELLAQRILTIAEEL